MAWDVDVLFFANGQEYDPGFDPTPLIVYQYGADNKGVLFNGPDAVIPHRWQLTGAGPGVDYSSEDVGTSYFPSGPLSAGEIFGFPTQSGIYACWLTLEGSSSHPEAPSVWDSSAVILIRIELPNTLSREERCRSAIIDTIKLLALPEIGDKVYSHLTVDETAVASFPCVICSEQGVQETDEQFLSTRDDVGYPVKVEICDRSGVRDHKRLGFYELTRQRIMDAFRNQQLMGVPESKINKIEPYVVVDPDADKYEFIVSGTVIRCVLRHGRGLS